ncbi:uncharacterized protein (UPF0548 family) [Sediminihabitans luteus]|uniref:Uncharacterized protein (UPF0548 family) n=1 Tax=Sediminihabitans luteus TaxID=1138585 RepID=A0A2M9CZE5_9CELL|nr:DUF1990 family protein [Sediminihabitans luteus]PJJ77223.1 uncharacterized protein (UPF0548 family) [Sediminihabitans luteus]GII98671.1 DUF1990 domain-containing protein [Sediminihabitans luteus]
MPGTDPTRGARDRPDPPHGLAVVRRVGTGPGALAAARDAVLTWQMHRRAGVRVRADGPAVVGGVVAVRLGPALLGLHGSCVVVHVEDGPGTFTMTYQTLDGHAESGTQTFALFTTSDGAVWGDVSSVSSPRPVLRRLGAVGILGQQAIALRYLGALRRIAETP